MISAQQLKQSVNPITGTVGFPVNLIELPGRNDFDASVKLLYRGNVRQNACTWNLDASTGAVGLGWNLDTEFIAVEMQQNGANADASYFYVGSGSASHLVNTSSADGKQVFQLVNYQPWLITYDAATETWLIVKEDGTQFQFGGGVTQGAGGVKTSTGNSVQWGVKWGSWIGSSNQTGSVQSQYAVVWNLSSVTSPAGDLISYNYSNFPDDQIPVGSGGLTYTRASYLSSITDAQNRVISFQYDAKVYDPAGQREYQAPHTGAHNTPNAYQDRYETRYLSSIRVNDAGQNLLMTLALESQPVGAGSLAKRYLTKITKSNQRGHQLPSVAFDYYYTDATGAPLGALKSVTLPEGSVFTYTLAAGSPALAQRTTSVLKSGYTKPRVYFYADYSVVTWFDAANKFANAYAYTWNGRWIEKYLGSIPVNDQYDNLRLTTQTDLFAIFRPSYTVQTPVAPSVYVYHRNPAVPGEFSGNNYALSTLQTDEEVELASGERFVAVLGKSSGQLLRYNWTGSSWNAAAPVQLPYGGQTPKYSIAANHNFLAVIARPYNSPNEQAQFTLYYVDPQGNWQTGFNGQLVTTAQNADGVTLYAGDSFVVLKVENDQTGFNNFRYQAINWSADYSQMTVAMLFESGTGEEYEPAIRGGLVGIDTNLFRYNGRDWTNKINLADNAYRYPNQTGGRKLAYGFDKVVRRVEQGTPDGVDGYAFDITEYFPSSASYAVDSFQGADRPSLQETQWSILPITSTTIRFPSSYTILSKDIYYEMPDFSWAKVGSIPDSVMQNNAASVQLLGSRFLCYQSGSDAVVVPLKNGGLLPPVTLAGESVYAGDGAGKQLAGTLGFATFKGSFDQPSSLTLYAVVAEGVSGAVTNQVVTLMTIADGFDTTTVAYKYEPAGAVGDPSGYVNLYNKVTVAEGGTAGGAAPYGYTEKYYFNGLPGSSLSQPFPTDPAYTNAVNLYGLFTGLCYLDIGYTSGGQVASRNTNYWMAYLQPLAQVTSRFFLRPTKFDNQSDGVSSAVVNTYLTDNGLLSRSSTINTNWAGAAEEVADATTYAHQAYPAMKTLNMLNQVAQTKHSVGALNTKITATTWNNWSANLWSPRKSYRSLVNTTDFNFAQWSGSTEPPAAQWLKTSEVTLVSSKGLVLESLTPEGTTASNVYDANQYLQVATFNNASVSGQEASYYGFESYEDAGGWQLSGGAHFYSGDAHTGSGSLLVPATTGGTPVLALQHSFRPATPARPYFFAFWVKTGTNFGSGTNTAYVRITFSDSTPEQTIPVVNTAGQWVYLCSQPVVPAAGVTVTVSAYTQNPSDYYLLDDIVFAPAESAFSASVYSTPFQLLSAKVTINAMTMRYVYDEFQRQTATVGPNENVDGVNFEFFARLAGVSPPTRAVPNSAATLEARAGGVYQYFRDGWQADWQTTNSGNWAVADGTLHYTGQQTGTAQWQRYGGQQNLGVRLQVIPPQGPSPTGKVALRIGTTEIAWQPDGQNQGQGFWVLNGTTIKNPVTQGSFPYAQDWALASVDGRVFFWANGWLIADGSPSGATPGNVRLSADVPIDFRDFITFYEPTVEVAYTDGLTNVRQRLTMDSATTVVVNETVYDGLARPAIQSKSSTYTVSATGRLFAYQAGYITNGGNNGTLWQTGQMQGDITNFYPADNGYTYSRTVFESSPLGRTVEVGQAGQNFAVGNNSTKYVYSTNSGGSLPASSYYVTTATNPDGVATATTTDKGGSVISQVVSRGGAGVSTTTYSYVWSDTAQTITIYPPAYFAPTPGIPPADFLIARQYNYLGQLVKTSAKAEGDNVSIYDALGRLRFNMTADGVNTQNPSQDVIRYHNYDKLGRVTDEGTLQYDWSQLPALAPQSYFPPATPTPRTQSTYFGPDTLNCGRLKAVSVSKSGTPNAVVKNFTYDAVGNIATVTLQVPEYKQNGSYKISYEYDNFHNPTAVTYLDANTLRVQYAYNRRGLVQMAQKPGTPAYATYLYNANGSILKESLGIWGSQGVAQTYTYNPPGWLSTLTYRFFAQTLLYDSPGAGYQGATYFSGLVQAESCRPVWNGAPAGYTNKYKYDALSRLQYDENNLSTDWGIGIGSGVQYDANGNLLKLNRGNIDLKYQYQVANRVAGVTGDVQKQLSYRPGGEVSAVAPVITSIGYDDFSGMMSSMAVSTGGGQQFAFTYDEGGQRVYKQVQRGGGTVKQLYVRGVNNSPLAEFVTDAQGAETVTLYVHTPNGMVALVRNNATLYVVRDALNSTRVVFDSQGNVVASFDYMPFGKIMRTTGDPTLISYRYTGQEFDGFSATPDDGIYNYRARAYDWNLSRFAQPDPGGQFPTPYSYVGNNPVSFTDPTGESWWEALGVLALVLGATGVGALAGLGLIAVLGLEAALPAALAITGAYAVGRFAGGIYAIATGVQGTDLIDYANSYGVAAATAVGAGLLGPAAGLSRLSIATAEGFGVMNGFSLTPSDANPATRGYYIAAGIAISFGSEALGNAAAARYARVSLSQIETVAGTRTTVGAVQKGVAGFTSGALVSGGAAALAGQDFGRVAYRTAIGGLSYGVGSFASAQFRGANALYGGTGVLAATGSRMWAQQLVLEKTVKQIIVMGSDPTILWSRVNLAKTWMPVVVNYVRGT